MSNCLNSARILCVKMLHCLKIDKKRFLDTQSVTFQDNDLKMVGQCLLTGNCS